MKVGCRQQLLSKITVGKNLEHLRKSLVLTLFHSALELKIFEFSLEFDRFLKWLSELRETLGFIIY